MPKLTDPIHPGQATPVPDDPKVQQAFPHPMMEQNDLLHTILQEIQLIHVRLDAIEDALKIR